MDVTDVDSTMTSINMTSISATNFNASVLSAKCGHYDLTVVNIFVSILLFLLFPWALLLNSIATWVSLHLRSSSTFIVYLKNLVAADLLMALSLPFMAASMQPGVAVEFRAFTCRYSDVVFYCSLYTSIALMGLISLDRFIKIVKPWGLGQSVVFSRLMSALVWLVMFGGTCIPTMILTNKPPANVSSDFCMSLKSKAGLILHSYVVLSMEIIFWLVCVMIVFCYICITVKVLQSFRNSGSNNSKGKKKTKLRVFLILLVFCVCFVPLHIMRIPFTLHEVFGVNMCTHVWIDVVHQLTLCLSTTNACLDPLLYIFLCREYRDKLVDMMKTRGISVGWCLKEKDNRSQ